ncbi:hypothetical protein [Methanobrevibacter sp.]|uniref:hypothetical protein n=1 Tax=Methanobrevibacter sp. TaxID=66852 RepID=UPI0025F39985|nr:hypothetical protein [Methanobrevibacter sp.]MBR6993030.1 hypothetical protein [Methanobrevibacter sp.]
MKMKDATILLIFLLAILGLIIGVCYTEAEDIEKPSNDNDEIAFEGSGDEITITLEPKEKNESIIDKLFT